MGSTCSIVITSGLSSITSSDSRRAVVEKDNFSEANRARREALAEASRAFEIRLAESERSRKALLQSFEKEFEKYLDNVEEKIKAQLVSLSVRVAEVILRHEIPGRSMIEQIICESLEPVSNLEGARVRLCPSDAEAFISARKEGGAELLSRVQVVSDASLKAGDVLIESRNGFFDATISERLKLLEERLAERCRQTNADNTKS